MLDQGVYFGSDDYLRKWRLGEIQVPSSIGFDEAATWKSVLIENNITTTSYEQLLAEYGKDYMFQMAIMYAANRAAQSYVFVFDPDTGNLPPGIMLSETLLENWVEIKDSPHLQDDVAKTYWGAGEPVSIPKDVAEADALLHIPRPFADHLFPGRTGASKGLIGWLKFGLRPSDQAMDRDGRDVIGAQRAIAEFPALGGIWRLLARTDNFGKLMRTVVGEALQSLQQVDGNLRAESVNDNWVEQILSRVNKQSLKIEGIQLTDFKELILGLKGTMALLNNFYQPESERIKAIKNEFKAKVGAAYGHAEALRKQRVSQTVIAQTLQLDMQQAVLTTDKKFEEAGKQGFKEVYWASVGDFTRVTTTFVTKLPTAIKKLIFGKYTTGNSHGITGSIGTTAPPAFSKINVFHFQFALGQSDDPHAPSSPDAPLKTHRLNPPIFVFSPTNGIVTDLVAEQVMQQQQLSNRFFSHDNGFYKGNLIHPGIQTLAPLNIYDIKIKQENDLLRYPTLEQKRSQTMGYIEGLLQAKAHDLTHKKGFLGFGKLGLKEQQTQYDTFAKSFAGWLEQLHKTDYLSAEEKGTILTAYDTATRKWRPQ